MWFPTGKRPSVVCARWRDPQYGWLCVSCMCCVLLTSLPNYLSPGEEGEGSWTVSTLSRTFGNSRREWMQCMYWTNHSALRLNLCRWTIKNRIGGNSRTYKARSADGWLLWKQVCLSLQRFPYPLPQLHIIWQKNRQKYKEINNLCLPRYVKWTTWIRKKDNR